jgi:bacterioferritin (cytochrome b1)
MTKADGIHENFFSMPELPYKRKEREAIKLLQEIIDLFKYNMDYYYRISKLINENEELVDWIMKYKGK